VVRLTGLRWSNGSRRSGPVRPQDLPAIEVKHDVMYAALVRHLDARLSSAGELGFAIVDGDGRDASYFAPHRALSLSRPHLLEDPFFQESRRSQWV
jgi:hypothetical protein